MSIFASMFNRVSDAKGIEPTIIEPPGDNPVYECFKQMKYMRNATPEEITALWFKARDYDKELSDNLILFVRDFRHGLGERRIGRILFKELSKIDPNKIIRNFETIVKVGRWDDLYTFIGTPVEGHMWQFFEKQLRADYENAKRGESITTLAKWAKSINASSAASRAIAKKTCTVLNLSEREYRKILSFLRARLNIVERKMSENRWDEIEISEVPRVALKRYMDVFRSRGVIPALISIPKPPLVEVKPDEFTAVLSKNEFQWK